MGAGEPLAVTLNTAVLPVDTVNEDGTAAITGALARALTFRVAAALVTVPKVFVTLTP